MSRSVSRHVGVVATAAFALCGLAALALHAADTPGEAAAKTSAGSTSTAGGRYFEMRTYHAAPGKLDALHARFRDHTMRLFKKHGIDSVAYWTVAADESGEKDTLVFVLGYPDKDARDKLWNAFAGDPDWKKAKEESEKDGPLVEKVEQTFMTPTDYSPLK